jgi:hypothetical protein
MGHVTSEGGRLVQKHNQNCDCCPKYRIETVEELEQWRTWKRAEAERQAELERNLREAEARRKVQAEKERALWQRVAERKRENRKRKRFDEEKDHTWLLSHTGKLSYRERRLRDELLQKRAKREEARRNPVVLVDDDGDGTAVPTTREERPMKIKDEYGLTEQLANIKEEPVSTKREELAGEWRPTALPTPPPSSQPEQQADASKTIIIDLGDEDEEDEEAPNPRPKERAAVELDMPSISGDEQLRESAPLPSSSAFLPDRPENLVPTTPRSRLTVHLDHLHSLESHRLEAAPKEDKWQHHNTLHVPLRSRAAANLLLFVETHMKSTSSLKIQGELSYGPMRHVTSASVYGPLIITPCPAWEYIQNT